MPRGSGTRSDYWGTVSLTFLGAKGVPQPSDVTQLLIELRAGNQEAEAKLIPPVSAELRLSRSNGIRLGAIEFVASSVVAGRVTIGVSRRIERFAEACRTPLLASI
jgi:hypothetical protein